MNTSITLRDNIRVAHVRRILWTFSIAALLTGANPASAEIFATTENQITTIAAFESTPSLGSDAFGDMTSQTLGPWGLKTASSTCKR